MTFVFTIHIIPVSILFLSLLMNMRVSPTREKSSPFECGFDPMSSSRVPFSLRFFILMVLFLIFDIEIVLMLPLPFLIKTTPFMYYISPTMMFIIILLLGLFHEWNEGSLEWAN